MESRLNTIQEAISDVQNGKIIIIVDDDDRENEGDFMVAARFATPEVVNFMATQGRGLICAPLTGKRCDEDLTVSDRLSPVAPFRMFVVQNPVLSDAAARSGSRDKQCVEPRVRRVLGHWLRCAQRRRSYASWDPQC